MQRLKLGQTNRIYLDTEMPVDEVTVSILTTLGVYLKDSGGSDLNGKDCLLDETTGKYYYEVAFHSTTTAGDCLIYWQATKNSVAVNLEDKFEPEDGVITEAVSTEPLLVTPSFVMSHYLRGISESDIEATWPGPSFRETIRSQIKTATTRLEGKVRVWFTKRTVSQERHEYYMDGLYEKFWQVALYHQPIHEVTTVELVLNEHKIVEIPSAWVQIGNKDEGLVKVVPYAGGTTGLAYTMIYKGALGLAIILGGASYIPDFFAYTYTAGLDYDNLPVGEKEELKDAISRRVALNMLPNLDMHRGKSSESRSIDGASVSTSFTSSATFGEHSAAIERYQKEEVQWIEEFKRRHLTRLQVEGY